MKKNFIPRLWGMFLLLSLAGSNFAAWWEQPHDQWYFKDDWKGALAGNYAPKFKLHSPAASGWIVIWGDQGVDCSVNGKPVMKHVDRGLIYDADLTPFIHGALEIELQCGPGKIVAEGEWVDDQGRRYPFASGCDWPIPAEAGAKLAPSKNAYRPGEASGAFHTAHNGLLLRYNDEERGKAGISKTLARIQKLRDQSIFLLRRFRSPEDVLSFSPDTLWRRAENYAAGPMAQAETLVKDQAIPAQKAAEFKRSLEFSATAGARLNAAELAVNAARKLEEAERQLMHLEACVALMKQPGAHVPPMPQDLEEARLTLAAGRREAGCDDWANVQKRVDGAQRHLNGLNDRLSQLWGAPVGRLDEFPEDRLGWLNARLLLPNDPACWEFSLCNPDANWIDLRGRWRFRIDPKNEGESRNWHQPGQPVNGWRTIKVPAEWEREGVREDNDQSPWDCPYPLSDQRCEDKPYNGFAWYYHEVLAPKSWTGRPVRLQLGKVSNWCRVYINGQPVAEARKDGGVFSIPAEILKPGETNTLAVQVYNHDNFGGIVSGPVAIFIDGAPPRDITTPGPMSYTTETQVKAADKDERWVTYASAMSPAVVVASDQSAFHIWGWEAKGYEVPALIRYAGQNGITVCRREAPTPRVQGADLAAGWLSLEVHHGPAYLLTLAQRPAYICWTTNSLGGLELTIQNAAPGNQMVVMRAEADKSCAACDWAQSGWIDQCGCVPIACSELARLDKPNWRGEYFLKYHYYKLADFMGRTAREYAPLPALAGYYASYASSGILAARNRAAASAPMSNDIVASPYEPYPITPVYADHHLPKAFRFLPHTNEASYVVPLLDKSKLLKGVGELFAKSKPEHNARGGNTEPEMFDDWKAWGFDHCRYAFAWGAPWDIPLQKYMGGPINDNPELWARMDALVKQHTDRGIMAMLCYFFNEDQPQRDSKSLVRNSTRYWRMHPEVRAHCYELWRRIASRYKDYPRHLIAYDFFNEPAYMHRDDWNQIIKDLTGIVRAVDPNHLIVCEAGDGWSQPQWFHWVEPTGDTNTIYSFHHYGKHWGYDRDEYYPGYAWTPEKETDILLEALLFSLRYNVPIHCGEFGVSMISPGEDHRVWLDDYLALFERFGIGWNWWNWSGADIYRTGLKAGEEISPNLVVLRKWIDRKKSW